MRPLMRATAGWDAALSARAACHNIGDMQRLLNAVSALLPLAGFTLAGRGRPEGDVA